MSDIDLHEKIKKFLDSALKKISEKEFDKAISELESAEILDRNNPEILYNLGICYCKNESYDKAIIYFKKLLDLPFTFVDVIMVYKLLSYSLIKTGNLNQAWAYLNDGLKLSRGDTTILNMIGYSFEQENKLNEAEAIYREIIEIDEFNFNAYNSLAYIIARNQGNLNEAQKYINTALESNPDNPAYLDTQGYIYIKKGHDDLAKKYLKKALMNSPDSAEIRDHINQLLKIKRPNN